MREFGLVPTQFWQTVEREQLSERATLLALYLLTSSHGNMMGCFRLPRGYVASDFRWSISEVEDYLNELEAIAFMTYDRHREWLVIHDFLRWHRIDNTNHGKNIAKLFDKIPEDASVLPVLIPRLQPYHPCFDEAFRQRLDALSLRFQIPFRNPMENLLPYPLQIKDKEKDKERDKNKGKEKNTSPEQKDEDIVITLLLKDNTAFPITQHLITEWTSHYSPVDILHTLHHIREWNVLNPRRRKSKSGILKHITGWLTKEQTKLTTFSKLRPPPLAEHNQAVVEQWLKSHSEPIIEGECSHDA